MTQNLQTFEKILSRSQGNYLAYLSVDSMQADSRINKLLSRLTLFTVIFVPMNLVTGLWGMNVPVPGRDTDNVAWFMGIIAVMVGWVIISFLVLWRWRVI
jgi:magnesium transporter